MPPLIYRHCWPIAKFALERISETTAPPLKKALAQLTLLRKLLPHLSLVKLRDLANDHPALISLTGISCKGFAGFSCMLAAFSSAYRSDRLAHYPAPSQMPMAAL